MSPADAVGKLILKRSGYKGETFACLSLKDYIFRLHDICPQVVRRFWRVCSLNPNDVLEILLGSECELGGYEIEVKKVESLWGIFKMASDQVATFDHLPQSCKFMASMLVRTGLYGEAEHLLSRRECERVLVDFEGIFSDLIAGYTKEFQLDKAIEIYKRMRKLSLVPSVPTYHTLIKYLVELNETALMHVVYEEMVKMHAITGTVEDMSVHDDVIRMLCKDGKVQEARDLVRKFLQFKIEPSDLVVSAICRGYCYKKDYDDLLSFLAETSVAPDALIGNKILFSFCQNFGVDHAIVFLRKLEELGYCPDEITLGILISFSCREGKLKNALIYISDILSRGAKPHVYTYNALLSGTFKKRMWMYVRDILLDMNEVGVSPNMSTFRVLIAGFCQARKFDEVKAVVSEMEDRGLIKLSSVEDPITRAFTLVGLSPSQVKIKRDNDKGFSRTEFYDDLGNGLYLDTVLNEYEKKVAKVLDDVMVLDFNSIMIDRCRSQDIKGALSIVDDIVNWGQRISQPAFALLLDLLSRTSCNINTIDCVLDIMFASLYQLDHKALNLLVQTYSKNGFTSRARTLVDGMLRRCQLIEEGTFSTLLVDSCKNGDLRNFHHYFKISQKSNSFLEIKDCESLLGHLIRNKWLNEALELFEIMLSVKPDNVPGTFHLLFERLSRHGFCDAAYMLVEEFANKALFLDNMDYQYLISRLCRENRFREASKLYDVMLVRDVSPPVDASIELISHLCRTNRFDRAVQVKNLCSKNQPSALNHLNHALISGACKLRRLDEAISLFKEVLSKDPPPNVEVFNSLIKVHCDENDMKKVRELLGYVIKNGLSISTHCYSNIDRQLRIWGEQGQAALEKSSICLLNCGPTGSETLKNLVLGGVGSITVVDGSKVEIGDLGNNFLVDESSVGQSKAKTVCSFLQELNDAVNAKFVEENPEALIETHPSFFLQFTLVIATQLVEDSMVKLDKICRDANVLLIFVRSYGLTGFVRISAKEHSVIESKPDHFLDDLRLNNPWPELKRFAETIDLETSDPVMHKHTPYVIILIKIAKEWAKTHGGNLPSTREEKRKFKDLIKSKMISSDEDNYKEAMEASFKVFAPQGIGPTLQQIIADKCSEVNSSSSDFWVLVAALKEFIANEGGGEAPLEGSIPDMTSSTELYVNLQKIYQAKAEADIHIMEQHVKNILKKIGKDQNSISKATIKSFCKNARKIKVCRYRSMEDEYMSPSVTELQKYLTDEEYSIAAGFYILLRAADRFYCNYNSFPGQYDGAMDEEISRLKTTAVSLLNDLGCNSSPLTEDLINEMCRYGASELHAVAALIGGIASQEVIKLITRQFVPLSGTFIFSGIDHKSLLLNL